VSRATTPLRRAALAAGTLAAAGWACAAPRGGTPAGIDPAANTYVSTRIDMPKGSITIDNVRSAPASAAFEVAAPVDRAFDLLPGIYDALGVPINTVVSEVRTVGVRDGRVTRRLGKVPLSRFVACGPDLIGTDRADTYAVTLTVISQVSETGGAEAAAAGRAAGIAPRSTVSTQVMATARPISVSGDPVQCSSTGRLERAIRDSVVARARQ
jgi:hypothetical protein